MAPTPSQDGASRGPTRKLRSSTELWQDDLNNVGLRKAPGTTSYSFTAYSKVQNELRVASANRSRWERRTSSVDDDAIGEIDPELSNLSNSQVSRENNQQTDGTGNDKNQPAKANMPPWGTFSTTKKKRGRPKSTTSTDQGRRKSVRIASSEVVPADDVEDEQQNAVAECACPCSTASHDVPPTIAEAPLPPPPAHMTLPSQPLPSQTTPVPGIQHPRTSYLQTVPVQQCPSPHGHQQPLPHLHTWAGYNLNDPRVDHTIQPFATALDAYLAAGTNLALQYRLLLDSGVVPLAVGAQDFYRAHGEAAGMSEAIHSLAVETTSRMGPAAYTEHARNQHLRHAELGARQVRPQFYQQALVPQQLGRRPGSGQP